MVSNICKGVLVSMVTGSESSLSQSKNSAVSVGREGGGAGGRGSSLGGSNLME